MLRDAGLFSPLFPLLNPGLFQVFFPLQRCLGFALLLAGRAFPGPDRSLSIADLIRADLPLEGAAAGFTPAFLNLCRLVGLGFPAIRSL